LFETNPADVALEFPANQYPGLAATYERVRGVFEWGKRVEKKWIDAEQFLACADEASADLPNAGSSSLTFKRVCQAARRHDDLGEWISSSVFPGASAVDDFLGNVRQTTRQALAAECTRFLIAADPKSEAWLPYWKWARSLQETKEGFNNTVITFNYDRVLETLGQNFEVPLPSEVGSPPSPFHGVRVLKLHGSVDWAVEATGCSRVQWDLPFQKPATELAIAAPGRSKASMTDTLFQPLWHAAKIALRKADAIIFLGYSFPPTDAQARQGLLGAIAEGNSSPLRRIDIVLGEDLNAPRVRRMKSLILASKGARHISSDDPPRDLDPEYPILQIVQPSLWAEDYLEVHDGFFRDLTWQ
jgi:hypothetical protein